ncbi:acyltransferase family protein [Sorangium sp. So ce1078]|uniref:acyltransferase family protein n=1 Tax=Sorangium sp. So ce1078 TaxID=3133329 RepID=UPI003F63302A
MSIDSPLPYFVIMPLFIASLWLLQTRTRLLDGAAFTGAARAHRSLEGLRGVLASAVFFHHALIYYYFHTTHRWAPPASRFYGHLGYTSVALFFLLSGFLFWGKLRHAPAPDWVAFVKQRARRIVPVHLFAFSLALLVVAVHSRFELRESLGTLLRKCAQWLLFGLPFISQMLRDADINAAGVTVPAYGNIWTLHFEWLFYLVLPGLVWLTASWRRAAGFVPVLGLVASSALYLVDHAKEPGLRAAASLEVCAFAAVFVVGFLPGMASTYVLRERFVNFARRRPLADLIVVASLALFVSFLPANGFPHYLLLIVPFALIAAGNDVFGLLSARPILLLGRISYSLYMLHCAVTFGLLEQVGAHVSIASMSPALYWTVAGAIGLVCLALSMLSYRFIEYPWLSASSRVVSREPAASTTPG